MRGTVGGCVLKSLGLADDVVFEQLKRRHPDRCPENDDQRQFIRAFPASNDSNLTGQGALSQNWERARQRRGEGPDRIAGAVRDPIESRGRSSGRPSATPWGIRRSS